MEFRTKKLDNGLEIVAEVNSCALSAAMGYFVKTGSRDETAEMAGVSHFLEHMLFKGTACRSAVDLNRELDELGSQSNAYTTEEQTVYHMTVLPEYQSQSIDLLTDMMRPALREEDFETERQVILEEIAMYDDQPPYGAMERAMEAYFGTHPLARRVLGTPLTVRSLATEQMREYHRRRYAADNLCFVATGAIDFDAAVEQIVKLTAGWMPVGQSRSLAVPTITPQTIELYHAPAVQQYTIQFSPGPSRFDPQRFASRVLATVLGDESGSRLFWELVDSGLVESAAVFTQEFEDCGIVGSFITCDPEHAKSNWQLAQAVIQKARREPITNYEIEQAKNKICSSIVLSAERPSNRLFSVGNSWTLRGVYETVREVADNYRNVSEADVQRSLVDWLSQPSLTISIGPLESGAL